MSSDDVVAARAHRRDVKHYHSGMVMLTVGLFLTFSAVVLFMTAIWVSPPKLAHQLLGTAAISIVVGGILAAVGGVYVTDVSDAIDAYRAGTIEAPKKKVDHYDGRYPL